MAVNVLIRDETLKSLEELSLESGESVPDLLQRAVEELRRKEFFGGLAADVARLRSDPEAWEAELEERRLWEGTLGDGLDD